MSERYSRALELPKPERTAWIAEQCGDDTSLRRRIEKLLDAREKLGGFLDGDVRTQTESPAPAEFASPAATEENVGPYRIVSELGRGGMGVVYKAEDPRLGRFVALKFLPPHLVARPRAKKRLLSEARAASRLDHPNICTVHDIGETPDGRLYITMAYYEGQTLADRILQGPLPAAEAAEIARQVAFGLAVAHEQGVIHRDIKPSNIYLTNRGKVKILDFGVAKHGLETLTDPGLIIGTVGYMPPETLLDSEVDHRGDLWSLGVTIYEMLAGRQPFTGSTNAAVLYAIVNDPPAALGDVPDWIEAVVWRLLSKEPGDRCQQAADLAADLEPGTGEIPARMIPVPADRGRGPWYLAGLIIAAIAAAGAWFSPWRAASPVEPAPPVPLTSIPGREENSAFSPDGKQIAFSWNGQNQDNFDIYVKLLDSPAPLRLTTDPAWDSSPVWSPAGDLVAFLRERPDGVSELRVVPPIGGTERLLTEVRALVRFGVAWSPDGQHLAVPDRASLNEPPGVVLVSAETGEKRTLVLAEPGAVEVRMPAFSPDGKTVAFDMVHGIGLGDTYLVPSTGGEPERLTFLNGEPEGLAWSADGRRLVFGRRSAQASRSLWTVDASGGEPRALSFGDNPSQPAVSPAGDRIAFSKRVSQYNILRVDTRPGLSAPPSLLISSTRFDGNPQYSPDGSRVVFSSSRSGEVEIWTCDADGANVMQLTSLGVAGSPRWSPDGSHIVFDTTVDGNAEIYVVGSTGGATRRITSHDAEDVVPSWSRDGKWIYFASSRSGQPQILKIPVSGETPGDPRAEPVTTGGGFYPADSPDGKFVFYSKKRSGETAIWKVPSGGGEETEIIPDVVSGWGNWVVNRDGIFFLNRSAAGEDDAAWAVFFYEFDQQETTEVAHLQTTPTRGGAGLGVSPDGRWILHGHVAVDSDLMMIEGAW